MKRNTPDHPKVYALAAHLSVPHASAVGYLEMLWHYTAKFAPQGDIGRHSDESIARALHYSGKAQRIVSALTAVGWLDTSARHRLIVHDWHEHADDTTKKTLARNNLPFLSVNSNLSGQPLDNVEKQSGISPDDVQNISASRVSVPLPEPEPEPIFVPTPSAEEAPKPPVRRPRKKREFIRPTLEEVKAHVEQNRLQVNGAKFWHHYEEREWYRGDIPMKNWKQTLHVWEENELEKQQSPQQSLHTDIPAYDAKAVAERQAQIARENAEDGL